MNDSHDLRTCGRPSWLAWIVLCAGLLGAAPCPALPPAGSLLYAPPDVYAPPASGKLATDAFQPDRAAAAAAFAEARQAVEAGAVSDAFRHACRTLAFDPDHADARRLLGYERAEGVWVGPFAKRQIAQGHAWDPRFGWVKQEHLAKFAEGLRPYGGRWIDAAEDARRHATIERGWSVRTDRFLVQTNIDRAAGLELATRLETLYQLWRQLFGEFAESPEELRRRLAGEAPKSRAVKPFRVRYHRTRAEYNDALRSRQPMIEMTLGIYFDADREAHFFAGEDQDPGTIDHEAVHQFFYESTPRATKHLAALANAWALEGAACYFESLAELPAEGTAGRTFVVGAAGRLPAARHRRLVDDYYVPLAELAALGMSDLQKRSDLPPLYSQSAGLAHFLIDGEGGALRGAFRELLAAIYAGRDAPDTLEKTSGRSFAELDAAYVEFLEGLPADAP